MKKMIALLAAALLLLGLAACGEQSAGPATQTQTPAEAGALVDKLQQKLDATHISFITENYEREYLETCGITAKLENAVAQDINTCTFDLVLENTAGKTLTLPFSGSCIYDYEEGELTYFRVQWGGICLPREGVLGICCGSTVTLVDTTALSVLDFAPQLPQGMRPVGVVWQEGLGYAVPCTDLTTSRICIYNESGAPVRETALRASRDGSVPFVMRNSAYGDYPSYSTTPTLMNYKGDTYLNVYSSYYSLTDGGWYLVTQGKLIEDGTDSVYLAFYQDTSAEDVYPSALIAVLCRQGVPVDSLLIWDESLIISPDGFAGAADAAAGTAELTDQDYDITLALDFNAQKGAVLHHPQEKHLDQQLAVSADGAYSLWMANEMGGGDALFYNIVLKENATGKLTYIAPAGGMWGGTDEVGFLKNGDFYITASESMKIYDSAAAECIFDLSERFPLGAVPEESLTRYLFAFRRDPDDFSFLVVYADIPDGEESYNFEESSKDGVYYYCYPFTYRVGRCDSTGALLESWDTGTRVIGSHFGLSSISLRLSGDKLMLIGSAGKGHPAFSGVFDLAKHIYTDNGFAED